MQPSHTSRERREEMPQHHGFGHLTLTVTDLERSADFYNRLLGSQTALASEDELGPFIFCMGPGFMVGLRKWEQTASAELEKWVAHLDENGVESSGIVESPFGLHLHAKDPDGIAIEFFVAAQQG